MSQAFRCNACGRYSSTPTLRIERADGFLGNAVRIGSDPWDLCLACSRELDTALGEIKVKMSNLVGGL